MRVAGSIAICLTLLGPFASPAASADQPGVAATCSGGWQSVGFPPDLYGMEAEAIASLAGQPAWVVGLPSALVQKRVPMFAKWNGSAWTRVPGPWAGYGILNGVEATSATNAWTVGSLGTYARTPISARWNGSSWKAVSIPLPAGQSSTLTDLAAVTGERVWAVGSRLVNGYVLPIAMLRRTGWRTYNPSIAANAEAALADVTLAPGGRLWAAGWKTDTRGEGRPWVIFRRDGRWRNTALTAVPPGRSAINDLTFRSATDGWAAGFVETINDGYQPLLQHWDGASWTAVPLPWAVGRSVILNGVEVANDGKLTVVGIDVDILRRDVTATRSGAAWSVTSISAGEERNTTMVDLARLSTGVVAAGTIDMQPITLFPCATGSAIATQATRADANEDFSVGFHSDEHDIGATAADPRSASITSVSVDGTVAVDATSAAGLARSEFTWGGFVADFDDDGLDDLFIGRHFNEIPLLMMNSGSGTFAALANNFELVDTHRCAAADVDLNGGLDVYCTVGVNKGTTNTPNELMLDVAEGGTWATRQFGLMDGFGRGREVTFLNLNRDAYPDVFVANEATRAEAMWSSNRLFRNAGGTGFVSAPEWGVDHSFGFGFAVAADLDDDGDDDLLADASEPSASGPPGLHVFINQGNRFEDLTQQMNLTLPRAIDVEVADFNGDGRLDVAQLTNQVLRVSVGTDGPFQQVFELSVSNGINLATGDVDADGRPDIYVARRVAGNAGNLMLVNRAGATNFVSMTIPQPGAGRADEVLAIDFDSNGRTDFVTLNGWSTEGPIQLTAFYPE